MSPFIVSVVVVLLLGESNWLFIRKVECPIQEFANITASAIQDDNAIRNFAEVVMVLHSISSFINSCFYLGDVQWGGGTEIEQEVVLVVLAKM